MKDKQFFITLFLVLFFALIASQIISAQTTGMHIIKEYAPEKINYYIQGEINDQRFGSEVKIIDDYNDDGYNEFIVGSPSNVFVTQPKVEIYSGKDGTKLSEIKSDYLTFTNFGVTITRLDDLNDDGYDEFAVSDTVKNEVSIYSNIENSDLLLKINEDEKHNFGREIERIKDLNDDGVDDFLISSISNIIDEKEGSVVLYSGKDQTEIFELTDSITSHFGFSISQLDDINNDGYSEIVVGAPEIEKYDFYGTGKGYVKIFSGKDGSLLRTHNGENDGDFFGKYVEELGNINNDGIQDYIISAPGYDTNKLDVGKIYAYSGYNGNEFYSFLGENEFDAIGNEIKKFIDFNHDRVNDYFVTSPFDDNWQGFVKLISGKTGEVLINYQGYEEGDNYAISIDTGKINQDRKHEILIGASQQSNPFISPPKKGFVEVFTL